MPFTFQEIILIDFFGIERSIILTWCLLSFHHTKNHPKEKVASREQDDESDCVSGAIYRQDQTAQLTRPMTMPAEMRQE